MKDELAERLLSKVMNWSAEQLREHGGSLQALARYKYDEYEGFRPGEKFLESLARWLHQFESEERKIAVDFILKHLIFISRAELEHAIQLVYPDIIRPLIRERAGVELGLDPHLIARITGSEVFQTLQRKLLIIGMADGARLDRLRRASPELSHEQFLLVPDPADGVLKRMCDKLEKALRQLNLPSPAKFRHVLLVDDFTGSGFTLIRQAEGSKWEGKLIKVRDKMQHWSTIGVLEADTRVTVVMYVASQRAERYVKDKIREAKLDWDFRSVQLLPDALRVTEDEMVALCKRYYDPILNDEHKGEAVLGFRDSALPLVLSHNTPNNSIALLWGRTSDREDSELRRHALFPRYERHHIDRP